MVALVRNLADVVGGRTAYCVPAGKGSDELAVVAASPETASGHVSAAGVAAREPVLGGGVLLVACPARWGRRELAVVRETAGWLGITAQLDSLRAGRDRAQARALGLRAEVAAARHRLTQVRELERRRLVDAIATTTLRDVDTLRRRLRSLAELPDEPADVLAEARTSLDELLDEFRVVVRGVYPAMLPDVGPQAAIEELAATLSCPVRFAGDLGRRASWHVEAGFYHAVAAVLRTLAAREPLSVLYHRDEAMCARITGPAGDLPVSGLQAALAHDAERLAVLGGSMEFSVAAGSAEVTVRLAERIEPTVRTPAHVPRAQDSAIYRQMTELVQQGLQAARDDQERARWNAVAARMAQPARLAIVTRSATDLRNAVWTAGLGVTVIVVDAPADAALAREFLSDGGSRGSIDAVLCLVPPAPAFRSVLRWGRHRVELSESASVAELAAKLVERGPVMAARRAAVSARELIGAFPPDHPLQWALDRLSVESHEITELDLLDDLERADTHLLRGSAVDAARLLGARGTTARARLGLPEDADDEQVRTAARHAVTRWRAYGDRSATSAADRFACEALVRTSEGILAETPTGEQIL